ncbi:MAG: ribosome-associated translation inhibitor RaiA [Clostridia bacterium]
MRISIAGKNLEISDYLRDLVEKKVGKLERYFPQDTEVLVTLSVEKSRHIVEVTIPYDGGVIRGEEVTGDMYASIDNVLDKLEKQIIRHRTRLEKALRSGAFKYDEPVFSGSYEEIEENAGPSIVRVKRFNIKPMSEEEAMLQIEMIGHSFYVFMNSETNLMNVIYKRKDGNYGLIEPEV